MSFTAMYGPYLACFLLQAGLRQSVRSQVSCTVFDEASPDAGGSMVTAVSLAALEDVETLSSYIHANLPTFIASVSKMPRQHAHTLLL